MNSSTYSPMEALNANSQDQPPKDYTIITVLKFSLVAATLISNLVGMVTILPNYHKFSIQGIYMASLCLADLLQGFFVLLPSAISGSLGGWFLSEAMCRWAAYFFSLASNLSLISLLLICVDKYAAVVFPYGYLLRMTLKKGILTSVICWVVSTAGFSLMLWKDVRYSATAQLCIPADRITQYVIGTFEILIYFIILGLNIKLFRIARKHIVQIKALQVGNVPNESMMTDQMFRSVYTVLLITSTLFATWTPVMVTNWISASRSQSVQIPRSLKQFCMWLFYSNSAMNTVIYVHSTGKARDIIRAKLSKAIVPLSNAEVTPSDAP